MKNVGNVDNDASLDNNAEVDNDRRAQCNLFTRQYDLH